MFYQYYNGFRFNILPKSPHASFLLTGEMTLHLDVFENDFTVFNCGSVRGWDHIRVFIAGASNNGLLSQSHALIILV